MANPNLYYDVLEKPLITEKSSGKQELLNQYTFRVSADANKSEIRKAIETLFEVTVTAVNTIKMPNKRRRVMGRPGMTAAWKKAVVTLKEGDEIDLA